MRCGGFMGKSRRQFLAETSLGVLAAAVGVRAEEQNPAGQNPADLPPGAPPAFGAGPAVGPEVSTTTFAEAEKLVQFEMTAGERAVAAGSWRKTMAAVYERRTGPRKLALETTMAPASRWDPVLPGQKAGPEQERFVRSGGDPGPLPARDEDIAFAPVTQLSRWLETRKLSSERIDPYLSEATGAVRSQVARRDNVHARTGAEAGQTSGRRNRRGEISRAAARDSLGRQGSAGYRGDSDHVRRGAFPQPRAQGRRGGGQASSRGGRGAGGQTQPGRARAQRHMVWRADDESVAAGGGVVGLERGTGSGHGCGIGRLRDRERDRREHCQPVDALRDHRTAAHVW